MPNAFIDHEFTQPSELRDFHEWHQGIKHYGFWAIEVTDSSCLTIIKQCQQQLTGLLHPNYCRQPHITLSACGLIDKQHFNSQCLQQQIHALSTANLKAFNLQLSKVDSFTTAPYLAIEDPTAALAPIRKCLHSISRGEEVSEYIAHVTLGFYQQAYKTINVFKQLLAISERYCQNTEFNTDFKVNEIVFARYNTHEIQGRYQVMHRIPLV